MKPYKAGIKTKTQIKDCVNIKVTINGETNIPTVITYREEEE